MTAAYHHLWNQRNMDSFSKVIGLYQVLFRRSIEHFLPESLIEPVGDRSVIRLKRGPKGASYRMVDDDLGLGVEVEWLHSGYLIQPSSPVPFTAAERTLINMILETLDRRFRSLYDPDSEDREDVTTFPAEDLTVTHYLGTPASERIPVALEALRLTALSTYENRRVSTGVLLLGTQTDPADPERPVPPGAPRYHAHLSSLKTLHRICDGVRTLLLVDRAGNLAWPVDIERWVRRSQPEAKERLLCPRQFEPHARATASGGHVVLMLTPQQEIAVFSGGELRFLYSGGRWRLKDAATCFAAWNEAVGRTRPASLPTKLFQAAVNLAEQRRGALFLLLRDPERSIPQLLAVEDRIPTEEAADDPTDPDHLSPRLAKRGLHHLVRNRQLADLDAVVLEAIAGVDGAVVTDLKGRLISFGAIIRVTAESPFMPRSAQGARTAAALAASFHGPVLKVSEDGTLSMYLSGRRIWEI